MTEFPVPLDNLIAYVKTLHPDGEPLANVSDAFTVSTQMDEQSDALIGYFVDQARRSGLSWSQIGGAMGVSKQAAQKRFVPTKAADLMPKGGTPFSRFTIRAANVLAAAGRLAAPDPVDGAHLAAALLTEPDGVAAKAVAAAGITPEQFYAAVGAGPAPRVETADTAELLDVTLDEGAKEALKGGWKSALRHGHNYIGTEHLLLGLLSGDGPVTEALTGLGLPPERAEELVMAELAGFQARKEAN
ncbi:MAG TPA: Clp protease N-terminal domain-containing protein [Trebonia sp.]|nr:Clp protease N-terminal domain-containing protein [Trebonia sp.]